MKQFTETINEPPELEEYFALFRNQIIGSNQQIVTAFGELKMVYADWTASGRCYLPIEEKLRSLVMPFVGNTHTASTTTGQLMSNTYALCKEIIKEHVHANSGDVLLFCGSGMTAAVNQFQRLLGLRIPGAVNQFLPKKLWETELLQRPIVFITEMEHHSNQVSWLETFADVIIIPCTGSGFVDLHAFEKLLINFKHRKNKIASVTACSNVTGIKTPFHDIASMIHAAGGLCFVDFACSAPYVEMDMHPPGHGRHLDAIFFSPHKFLGGPGTPGVLICNRDLCTSAVPDRPGGGTVNYSNPWGEHDYVRGFEDREDGGTPPILQGIKAAMCVRLKEQMGIENMRCREAQLMTIIFQRLSGMKNVCVLDSDNRDRLGIISFIIPGAHHNLIVRLLNDRFGVQSRGGCSCAGTYGHRLLSVDRESSMQIRSAIQKGEMDRKPGWVRISVHPVMTNSDINHIMDAVEQTSIHFADWQNDYVYNNERNEFTHKYEQTYIQPEIKDCFSFER